MKLLYYFITILFIICVCVYTYQSFRHKEMIKEIHKWLSAPIKANVTYSSVKINMCPIDRDKFYKLPEQGSLTAAGADIYWSWAEDADYNADGNLIIKAGQRVKFHTNLSIEITDPDCYLDICSRSGLSINKQIVVINSPARIDSDYRGELIVGLKNLSGRDVIIEPYSRIAQCTIHRHIETKFELVDSIDNTTERGTGGLGSTGTK